MPKILDFPTHHSFDQNEAKMMYDTLQAAYTRLRSDTAVAKEPTVSYTIEEIDMVLSVLDPPPISI